MDKFPQHDQGVLSEEQVQDLENKVSEKRGLLRKSSRIIKDEVFQMLADQGILLQYPIADDELCAFVCMKRGQLFIFINSNIPYEKQVFAAAHELYHIWYDEELLRAGEMLRQDVLDQQLEPGAISQREAMANRFAAMLLVPKDLLLSELDSLGVKRDAIELPQVVRLMSVFGVPYKTMIRRLLEVEYLTDDSYQELLRHPDRDETSGVRLMQKRLQIGDEMQRRTRTIRLGNLVDESVTAYESGKISVERLQYLLSFARKTPDEFGIRSHSALPSEEEVLRLMEEDED